MELASRLSFFLWSSIPDDELLDLGVAGKLSNPAVLKQQVARMLDDPKSSALVSNFAGQWLYIRDLATVKPDPVIFADFDESLRWSMQRETELFFESIVRENRSALELLTANYTFLNERLAKHYGIPDIYGSQFRRVSLDDPEPRRIAGASESTDGDLASESNIRGAAREMGAGKSARCAASASSTRCASSGRDHQREPFFELAGGP